MRLRVSAYSLKSINVPVTPAFFVITHYFQDGTFKLTLEFSEEYPNKPPVVKFLSKMFHPNIYAGDGRL